MTPTAKRLTGWVAAVAIALLTAYSGWAYGSARDDGDRTYAETRDAVLDAGRDQIARLNSIDGDNVEEGLRGWLDASTGPLHDQLLRTKDKDGTTLQKLGSTARGTVTDAAVTQLDTRAGTAKVIATLKVEITPRTGAPATDRKRFEAGLARTGGDWKLTSLNAIAVGAS
ncbi:hypothetical protein RKE29_10330 [Streptomyces sp. B1866]|uniref:hypothetical protein n=1 Tax=Streptomyces sp. B1866 TaxID=3075431 RepID=UPI00289120D8|nr:hypothetical protein [Streptomyces sp. B1866]MDT3397036.1 hypothetical protein [Streptomyces sp. B1866]